MLGGREPAVTHGQSSCFSFYKLDDSISKRGGEAYAMVSSGGQYQLIQSREESSSGQVNRNVGTEENGLTASNLIRLDDSITGS